MRTGMNQQAMEQALGELITVSGSWVETVYPGLAYFNEVDRGGHFAAWEEPELFAAELRAAFKSLR
jgi:pimeloyl-ACP methyl ester carboxylesterase